MAGVKFVAKCLIQSIEGSNKMGIVFKIYLVYTDKPVKGHPKISLFGINQMRLFAISKF